jgi:hypothetical protein
MAETDPTADINPYAPPSIPDPLLKPNPGIGVWRDGYLLVVHRDAALPSLCVKTGLPAAEWIEVPVGFFDFSSLSRIRFTLRAPLSARAVWWRRVGPRIALVVAAVAFACVPLVLCLAPHSGRVYFLDSFGNTSDRLMIFTAAIVGLIACLFALSGWRLLEFHRHQRGYFWFTGARGRFLDHLPRWPGFDP